MLRVRFHRPMLAALGAALVLSACGSSGSDGATKTTTTKATTSTTENTDHPEAQARADAISLTVSDFPDGWEEGESGEPAPSDCDQVFSDDSIKWARSHGSFGLGGPADADRTAVVVATTVYESEESATAALAPFTDPEVLACMDDEFAAFASGANEVEGGYETVDHEVDGVDETVAARAEYTIASPTGNGVDVTLTVVAMRTGDLVTQVSVVSNGDRLPLDDLEAPLARIAELHGA